MTHVPSTIATSLSGLRRQWRRLCSPQPGSSRLHHLFSHPFWVGLLAFTAAVLWGWAYPLIKLGMTAFGLTASMTGGKMLFAGLRFFISGLIILGVARGMGRSFRVRRLSDWPFIVLFSLLNTTLHYAFFYFGLSHSAGARAAILNSLSVFLVVILACIFFKSDRMGRRKVAGCVVGLAGILALNLGGTESGGFTWLGDGFIILNAVCSAVASLMTRRLCRLVDVLTGTGISLSLGGVLLVVGGLVTDGALPKVTPAGLLYLGALIFISTVSFMIYNRLLLTNPIGKIAIYNSLIPVVGALTSCLFLNEPIYWKYVLAVALAATGIYLINKGKG